VQKLKDLVQNLASKVRRAVAVDETKLKVSDHHLFVWAAVDVDSK
jgi:transposase-like protein